MTTSNVESLKDESILKKLHKLQDEVHISWIKDIARIEELKEITQINEGVLAAGSVEAYFDDPKAAEYYIETFSKEVITNILRQHIIYGEDGDDVGFATLTSFVNVMIKFLDNPKYNKLFDAVMDIFDNTKHFYKTKGIGSRVSTNPKKLMTSDQFNLKLPRVKREVSFNEGDEIDVLSANLKKHNQFNKERIWYRGLIQAKDGDTLRIVTAEKPGWTEYSQDSFEIAPKGSMTKDYEWRTNLKEGDIVDCLDRGKIYPSTVLKVTKTENNGLPFFEYRIGFRVYLEDCPDYEKYRKFWPNKQVKKCRETGRDYFGDEINLDETIPYFSKRILPLGTHSNYDPKATSEEDMMIDDLIKYENEDGTKNLVIARPTNFNYYYTSIVENVAKQGFFSKINDVLSGEGDMNGNVVYYIFSILSKCSNMLHSKFVAEISPTLSSKMTDYLLNLKADELRNIKKDIIDTILKILNNFMKLSYSPKEVEERLTQFNIKFSIKLIKSTVLDKRIQAVKNLTDNIRKFRLSKEKTEMIIKIIQDNGVFNEIFGSNGHIQLMKNSRELLEILLYEDKLTSEDLSVIWNGTKKGDLEGKLTILKLLTEISSILSKEHVSTLYEAIIEGSGEDLIEEELQLFVRLCNHPEQSENIKESCIEFLKKCLYKLESSTGDMVDTLLELLFVSAAEKPESYLKMLQGVFEDLKTHSHTVFCYLIFTYAFSYKRDTSEKFFLEVPIEKEFFNELESYLKKAQKQKENNTIDLEKHAKSVEERVKFLITFETYYTYNGLTPLKNTLFAHKVTEKDVDNFYNYVVSKAEGDTAAAADLFNFFASEILKGKKNIQTFSIKGFNCLKALFLIMNEENKKLIVTETHYISKKELLVKPDELDGLDLIWTIMIESFSIEILQTGLGLINELNSSSDATEESNKKLIDICIDMLKVVGQPDVSEMEKTHKIKKCLMILSIIIEESEKKGTANVKSHGSILRQKVINLKINSKSYDLKDTTVKVYSNTTLWDLKCIIAKKLDVCEDFLKMLRKNVKLEAKDNGKMLSELEIEDGEALDVKLMSMDKMIPKVELLRNGEIVPELLAVFEGWYDKYNKGTKGKMTRKECGEFVKAVLDQRYEIQENDERIGRLFNMYETDSEGFLTQNGFVSYFREAAENPTKHSTLWDNLKTMGIRNDLKSVSDPYEFHNNDKNKLPRYFFGHDKELFNSIFSLQEIGGEIGEMAHDFLNVIATNPDIYIDVLSAFEEENKLDSILDSKNVYKMLYSLQIIESFIEELDSNDQTVDCLSGEAALIAGDKFSSEEILTKKSSWIEKFIKNEGFDKLISILIEQLKKVDLKDHSLNKIDKKCSEYLLKIIKTFFFTALAKKPEFAYQDDNLEVERKGSFEQINEVFNGELAEKILGNPNLAVFAESLVQMTVSLLEDGKEDTLINNAFEFLNGIIVLCCSSEEASMVENMESLYTEAIKKGLLSVKPIIRESFSTTLIRLIRQAATANKQSILKIMVKIVFTSVLKDSQEASSSLFEVISTLIEEYYLPNPELETVKPIESFLKNVVNEIDHVLSGDSLSKLSSTLYIGYLSIIVKVCNLNSEFRSNLVSSTSIFDRILDRILFVPEKEDGDLSTAFVDLDQKLKEESANCSSNDLTFVCYDLIVSLIKSDFKLYEKLFSIDVLDEKKSEKEKESYYSISYGKKAHGHVGLRNLGCICYMNSMLQQFFMTPTLRKGLLQVSDNQPPQCDNKNKVDDNVLHQLQRMFSYLTYSERQDYNPHGFCYALKDWDGNPTNTMIQQDTQEFLNRILDVVENQIKPTPLKNIFNDVCAGKTVSQLICEDGCNTVRNRLEDFYNLSLDVSNMKTLHDSLSGMIVQEKIDDYHCETCNKKVTITKRNNIASLPNTLILHLKRITYDFELDRNKKINSRLEFPRNLNLKEYTIEECMRKNSEKEGKEMVEDDKVYFKEDSYYEYFLVGVVVHVGSADSGHYFSYINTMRNGEGNVAEFDPENPTHCDSWLEYNDSRISQFNPKDLENDCFGGSYESHSNYIGGFKSEKSQSAYILVYERKLKTPVKVMCPEPDSSKKVIEFEEEKKEEVEKQYNWLRRMEEEERKEVLAAHKDSVFFDLKKKEYFYLEPFFNLKNLIPKEYYTEIKSDNSSLKKHISVRDEKFAAFFNKIMVQLTDTLRTISSEQDPTEICSTLVNFIFKILANKERENILENAVEILSGMVKQHVKVAEFVLNYAVNNEHLVRKHVLCESLAITKNIVLLLDQAMLTVQAHYNINPLEEPASEVEKQYIALLSILYSKFPRIPERLTKYAGPLGILMERLYSIDINHKLLFKKHLAVPIFITYIIGKKSPFYKETLLNNESWDVHREVVIDSNPLIKIILDINSLSKSDDRFALDETELSCLQATSFIKAIFFASKEAFSTMLCEMNQKSVEFMEKSCDELTTYIDDIDTKEEFDENLFVACEELLNLKDEHQLARFEKLIGLPYFKMSDSHYRCLPTCGGYKHSVESEFFKITSTRKTGDSASFLEKMSEMRYDKTKKMKIWKAILTACASNDALLKYISFVPFLNDSSHNYISAILNEDFVKYDSKYKAMITQICEKLQEKLNSIPPTVLPNFKGFTGNYCNKEIVAECHQLIETKDNVNLVRVDYYCIVTPNYWNTDHFQEASQKGGPLVVPEDAVDLSVIDKPNMESEVVEMIKEYAKNGKKLMFYEEKLKEDECLQTVTKYCIYREGNESYDFEFQFKFEEKADANEYVPRSKISGKLSYGAEDLAVVSKIDPTKDWVTLNDLTFEYSTTKRVYSYQQSAYPYAMTNY